MSELIFETSCLGFKTKIFSSHISYKPFLLGEVNIPIKQIASIEVGMPGLQQVIVETTGGIRHKLVIAIGQKDKFRDAIYSQMT